MITQCMKCGVEFLHASQGRIFHRPARNTYSGVSESDGAAAFYWLCDECCARFTLKFSGKELRVTPLDPGSQPGGQPLQVNIAEEDCETQHVCPNCSVLTLLD